MNDYSPLLAFKSMFGFLRMHWSALIPAAASLVGGVLSSNASSKAAGTQAQSAADANVLQKEMYDQNREDQTPFREAGYNALTQYQSRLPALTTPFTGANLQNEPGYQFRLQEGQNALENSALNHGSAYSGQQMKAAQQYGQNFASNEFTNAFNRDMANKGFEANQLQSLTGLGQTSTNQVGQYGQNYAAQAGQNITGAGNARASGYIGQANALTGAIGQGYNGYQQNQLVQQNQNYQNQLLSLLQPKSYGGGNSGGGVFTGNLPDYNTVGSWQP